MSQQPAADTTNKKKALELAISHIQKQFGDGAIMTLGKHSVSHGMSVIKTGAIALDLALGIGGVPLQLQLPGSPETDEITRCLVNARRGLPLHPHHAEAQEGHQRQRLAHAEHIEL